MDRSSPRVIPNAPASPFDQHPRFFEEDNRQHRGFNPVTRAFLETRYTYLLPPEQVQGKRILDLGSCLGAAGQWVLFHGAAEYTGVEVQPEYAGRSRELLAHWGKKARILELDVRRFLESAEDKAYDLVIAAGMLYHFIDTKSIIDDLCRICRETIVVESNHPPASRLGRLSPALAVTEYVTDQEVNLASGCESLLGVSATTSLPGLDILFALNGFSRDGQITFPRRPEMAIYDESALGDTELPIRFAVHYQPHKDEPGLTTLEAGLPERTGRKRSWLHDPVSRSRTREYAERAESLEAVEKGSWRFDADVASRFQTIAEREIPDYHRVIDLCVRLIRRCANDHQPRIIDVGSALGETLRTLHLAGFRNLYGVEVSADMLARSFDQARLIQSECFPVDAGPFDFVLANWVLHFVTDRVKYLEDVYQGMTPGGYLILTEKLACSELVHELYYDFKRANGLSEAQIQQKRKQLDGVLETRSLSWYLQTLDKIGFQNVEIINGHPAFVTLLARR